MKSVYFKSRIKKLIELERGVGPMNEEETSLYYLLFNYKECNFKMILN
jgi:hypothetical protein